MVQQQRGQVVHLVIAGMLAEVQNLGHTPLVPCSRDATFLSLISFQMHNDPKEGGGTDRMAGSHDFVWMLER
jgi:hypothetical protein